MRWYVTRMAVEIPKWFVLEPCRINLMLPVLTYKTRAVVTVPHCVATTTTSSVTSSMHKKALRLTKRVECCLIFWKRSETAFPKQEEIDQGVYIGLLELHKLSSAEVSRLPKGWMKEVLSKCSKSFKRSHTLFMKKPNGSGNMSVLVLPGVRPVP
jgi:hypothetical protein